MLLTSDLMFAGGGSNVNRPRPACVCDPYYPCTLRLHHTLTSDSPIPQDAMFDDRWSSLLNLSGGFPDIYNRLVIDEGDGGDVRGGVDVDDV